MGYWHGSGIYATTITREIVCAEKCASCEEIETTCPAVWDQDFQTDDWGNVEQGIECKACKHTINYKEEQE
jgi:hypothetical protein